MSRVDSAALVSMSERHFDSSLRLKLDPTSIRGDGRLLRFYAPDVVSVWHTDRVGKLKAKQGADDPLMAEGDSPGLERYRNAKADLAEMERDRQRKQIVRVEEIEPALMQLAGVMRSAAENLSRQFGNEAGGIVNEAVDEWADGVAILFAGRDADATPSGGTEGTEAADDEAVCGAGVDTADGSARGETISD